MRNRYVVFFMTHKKVCDIREVSKATTPKTVLVPIDTQFFLFVQSDYELSDMEKCFYTTKCQTGEKEWTTEYNFGLPVENNKLFFIGKDKGCIIDNRLTGVFVNYDSISHWGMRIKVIAPKRLFLQTFEDHVMDRTERAVSHRINGLSAKYSVILESDGGVSSTRYVDGKCDVKNIFFDYDDLISDIKVVAEEYPEIYKEIIDHVNENQHIYYRMIADFCRSMIKETQQ